MPRLPALVVLCLMGSSLAAVEPEPVLPRLSPLDREVDAAIDRAIVFLAAQQKPTGGWTIDGFGGEATSATSLVLMALLADGHVPGDEPYRENFERGVEYLLTHQARDGLVVDKHGHGPLYCHGISTLLLAEIAGMVDGAQLDRVRHSLEEATRLILKAQAVSKQARHRGGWRYQASSNDSDLSVSAWQLLALRAARNIGCDVPAEAIDDAIAYVRRCGDPGGGFGYQGGSGASTNMTGSGLTALLVCGITEGPELAAASRLVVRRPPKPADHYYYYGVYYSAIGVHKFGGPDWDELKPKLFRDLLDQQQKDGSWQGSHGSERPLGKVYATSLAVLALTVEYGYLPIYQK